LIRPIKFNKSARFVGHIESSISEESIRRFLQK